MNRRRRRIWLWVASGGCAVLAILLAPAREPEPSLAVRFLGPIAPIAARVQWTRVDAAIEGGRTDVALARAELALALDPHPAAGWTYLSRHLAFELGSPEREADPRQRLAWIRAALEVAHRGEARAAAPKELAVWAGLVLAKTAATDEDLPWPGGVAGMWRDAAEEFARAARLGSEEAIELERRALFEAELAADR